MHLRVEQKENIQEELAKYGLTHQYGFIIPENYEPKLFNKGPIFKVLENLHQKIKNKQIQKCVKQMQPINFSLNNHTINKVDRNKDFIYLHGLLTVDVRLQRQLNNNSKQIGIPLYQVANQLKIKYGMCSQFYCNWRLKNQADPSKLPEDFEITDIQLLFHFTDQFHDETIFFGGSLVASFYLFKIIQLLYGIIKKINQQPNKCENSIITAFGQICKNLKKINQSNIYILNNMTQDFLMKKLKKYIGGYVNVNFQGVQHPLTTDGGAGGFDPCYQIFEKMIGRTQQIFRTGFPTEFINFINDMKQSPIRDYCLISERLRKYYNDVITQYGNFFVIHRLFIRKFIIGVAPSQTRGTGGTALSVIQTRSEAIFAQKLPMND